MLMGRFTLAVQPNHHTHGKSTGVYLGLAFPLQLGVRVIGSMEPRSTRGTCRDRDGTIQVLTLFRTDA